MIGLQSAFPLVAAWLAVPLFFLVLFVVFLTIKFSPIVSRYFQHQPPFMPLRVSPSDRGETVEFTTDDGLRLAGTYLSSRTPEQAGVIVYCHEYLSDRWSYLPYIDHLRDLGFDLFTFDFRNHGESQSEPGYGPMQWTTDREVRDLRAALETLRQRHDRDPAGFGLFGVSRGGTTGLVTAAMRARRLGRHHRWGVSDPRNDGPVHPSLVRPVRSQPDFTKVAAVVGLQYARSDGAVAHRTAFELPVPERRSGGGQAGTPALADDSRRGRLLYQPRDRSGPATTAARNTKSSGWSRTRSTIGAVRPILRGTTIGL